MSCQYMSSLCYLEIHLLRFICRYLNFIYKKYAILLLLKYMDTSMPLPRYWYRYFHICQQNYDTLRRRYHYIWVLLSCFLPSGTHFGVLWYPRSGWDMHVIFGTWKQRCATITSARYWHRRIPAFTDGESKPCPQCNVLLLVFKKTYISVLRYWYRGFPKYQQKYFKLRKQVIFPISE